MVGRRRVAALMLGRWSMAMMHQDVTKCSNHNTVQTFVDTNCIMPEGLKHALRTELDLHRR